MIMPEKRGLFVVLEGIDGAGTSTQLPLLDSYIKRRSKYNDVLGTHEPRRNKEIERRLSGDKDAFSEGLEMAELYILDRAEHTRKLINPVLDVGVFVLCDRYKMSTCAYQWTQGVELNKLFEMHKGLGILTPDITFYLDVDFGTAGERIQKRGEPKEKFEQEEFMKKLIENYRVLVQNYPQEFGRVVVINGAKSVYEVSMDIREEFKSYYDLWEES